MLLKATGLAKTDTLGIGARLQVGPDLVGEVHRVHELLSMRAVHMDVGQVLAVDHGVLDRLLSAGSGVLLGPLPGLRAHVLHAALNGQLHATGQVTDVLVGVASQGGVEGVDGQGQAGGASTKDTPQVVGQLADGLLGVLLAHVHGVDRPASHGLGPLHQLALGLLLGNAAQVVNRAGLKVEQRLPSLEGMTSSTNGIGHVHPVLLVHQQ